MGTVADSLFTALMSWVRALVSDFWAIFSSERTTILEFLGKHWIALTLLLLLAGLVIDWLVWFVRWQPYRLWAQRVRRLFGGRRAEEDEDEQNAPRAHAATLPLRENYAARETASEEEAEEPEEQEDWLPLAEPEAYEREEQRIYREAESVTDEALGAYPGMRYDERREPSPYAAPEETRSFSALRVEGPGAAEVARRREEIDEWEERQRQEEARARAEAEQARLLREAQEQERLRRAREAEAAERLRAAEQQRLEQERYAREMAEYEKQKAQYERDMAEYARKKAEYDAEVERIAEEQRRLANEQSRHRRAPQPLAPIPEAEESAPPHKSGLMDRMAKAVANLEPEQSEINAIASLPPRVDKRDAYAPAARPRKEGRRRR